MERPDSLLSCLRASAQPIRGMVWKGWEGIRLLCTLGIRRENPSPLSHRLCLENVLYIVCPSRSSRSCVRPACCSIWEFSNRIYARVRGWGEGQVWLAVSGWPQCALESVEPMWAQVWLALSCCVTACPMQSHQPVRPGKEPRPSPLLPSWPQTYRVWWLHSCKPRVIV